MYVCNECVDNEFPIIYYDHVGLHSRAAAIVIFQILVILVCVKYYMDPGFFVHCNARASHFSRHIERDNINVQPFINTSQSECTYANDITVYMDAFDRLKHGFFGPEYEDFLLKSRECDPLPGGGRCIFHHDEICSDAILYYGTRYELNFRRFFDDQIIVVFTMEAENGPYCDFPPPDQYDIKISYKRDSTVPKLFLCQDNVAQRLVEMGQPNVSTANRKLAASFVTNCVEWRADYLKELMKHIHIDQWGNCLKNTQGDFWKTRKGHYSNFKIDFLRKNLYKFVLSFENNVDPDYVSEKVYDAYLSRTIPIYYGDKGVFDLIPGSSTLIYANDYTPKELAELIKSIDSDDSLYKQYFTNWDLSKMQKLKEQYCSEYFMCTTCRKIWEILYNRKCGKK